MTRRTQNLFALLCLLCSILFLDAVEARDHRAARKEISKISGLSDFESLLGLSLGDPCEAVTKRLGKTKDRFAYGDTVALSFNENDKQRLDVRCQKEHVVSISIRWIGGRSHLKKHLEGGLVELLDISSLQEALGRPDLELEGAVEGNKTLYYCLDSGVVGFQFVPESKLLDHLLLSKKEFLNPNTQDRLPCAQDF